MGNSVYIVNKGINKSIEFKGLRAQYIWFLGAGILGLMVVFAAMYISGVNTFVCLPVILASGTAMVMKVYALSRKYGEFGMMKAAACRRVPKKVVCRSRRVFIDQKKRNGNGKGNS